MSLSLARRPFAIVLCLTMLLSIILVPAANAATIYKSSAAFTCTTMNDKTLWKRTSTVTFTNTGCSGPLKITATASNCEITSEKTVTIEPGHSYTFTIKTAWRKVSTTTFNVVNTWGCNNITYSIKSSNTLTIVRTK